MTALLDGEHDLRDSCTLVESVSGLETVSFELHHSLKHVFNP